MIHYWLPVLFLLIDQSLKYIFLRILPDLVHINPGIAFGIKTPSLLALGIVALVVIGWPNRYQPRIAWLLMTSAVLSNLIDRLSYGGVVDYIAFGLLRFNLADVLVITIAVYLAYYFASSQKYK